MTTFSRYLKQKQISPTRAAKELNKTKAYIHMFIGGTQTPSLKLAWLIECWSKGEVPMQSWCKRPPRR